MLLWRPVPGVQPAEPPARAAQTRSPVRTIDRRVELADSIRVRTRIGETKAAFLALDDHKPESRAARRGVGGLDQRRPAPAPAQQTVRLLPGNNGPCHSYRCSQVTR